MGADSGTAARPVVPVYFLSDSTGISAELMGNALLAQFPDLVFDRKLIPFISSVDEARRVVRELDERWEAGAAEGLTPLVFTTAASDDVRRELHASRCPIIDFFGMHMARVESLLGVAGTRIPARLHGLGDVQRYNTRMAAIEYAVEHDDGQSLRALDKADVVLVAPSRCGKTPTTMYLALQHGLFVANYPLLDEDLETTDLPQPLAPVRDRCYGLTTTPARLTEVRQQRRPGSRYASFEQCMYELRRSAALFSANAIPTVDSSAKSVEEMAAVILQTLRSWGTTRKVGA